MMTREVLVRRFRYLDKEILGTLMVFNEKGKLLFSCMTLELAYKDNRQNISCVPSGDYQLKFEYSPAFTTNLWELKGVPGRSEAKFHTANYYRQLNGCIALGKEHVHIDGDEWPDVSSSGDTLEAFHKAMVPATHAYLRIIGRA